MSLIQENTPSHILQQGNTMDTLVLTKLNDIQTSVNKVETQAALLNTKLFGDATSENDGGRLPRVEFLAANTASVVTELRDKYAREVIRDGPVRIESIEKNQVKTGTVIGIISTAASIIVTVILKFVLHI